LKKLNDGRGYTAGTAGFSTRDGDLLRVVKRYKALKPDNTLNRFIPVLEDTLDSVSTEGLDDLPAAWKAAAADPLFRKAQDQIYEGVYLDPALRLADSLDLHSALGRFALIDAAIQHGFGGEPDSIGHLISQTKKAVGHVAQVGERAWLSAFLAHRKDVLLNATDPVTRSGWRESVGRVNEQMRLLNEGNLQLTAPFTLNPYGTEFSINCQE
jgi:chitosanase